MEHILEHLTKYRMEYLIALGITIGTIYLATKNEKFGKIVLWLLGGLVVGGIVLATILYYQDQKAHEELARKREELARKEREEEEARREKKAQGLRELIAAFSRISISEVDVSDLRIKQSYGSFHSLSGRIRNDSFMDTLIELYLTVTIQDCLGKADCETVGEQEHIVSLAIPPRQGRDVSESIFFKGIESRRGTARDYFRVKNTYSRAPSGGFGNVTRFTSADEILNWEKWGGEWKIEDGKLFGTGKAGFSTAVVPKRFFSEDVDISIETEWMKGVDTHLYGIRFRAGTDGSYSFGITANGHYVVVKHMSALNTAALLIDWTTSPAINRGGKNTLRVVTAGSSFKFFINGTQVAAVTDTSFRMGRIGIGVEDLQTAAFDNLSITAFSSR